ncbi:DUF7426 family protein [Streptosporangium lutulentum]|uniref:DUF7426 domain-containing protein n=1 Tax=Streptosporangium lutulentum TaxID=1461250 RepID=A0ABT9Q926_9ACTN|nr:hypothetical protein [Streptosporangium lutulentum]MDP9843250.1 hypothetical protein [Streptosporangium lutulentum]
MAKLKALDAFLDTTLTLPIGGKEYTIPAPSAETGLLCQRLMQAGVAAANGKQADLADLDDGEELDLYQRCLGPVHGELLADKVSWPVIKLAGVTAFLWIAADLDTATRYWESGGSPEAQAPDPATSSAAASTTKSRGSTSGTNPRQKASRGKAS